MSLFSFQLEFIGHQPVGTCKPRKLAKIVSCFNVIGSCFICGIQIAPNYAYPFPKSDSCGLLGKIFKKPVKCAMLYCIDLHGISSVGSLNECGIGIQIYSMEYNIYIYMYILFFCTVCISISIHVYIFIYVDIIEILNTICINMDFYYARGTFWLRLHMTTHNHLFDSFW